MLAPHQIHVSSVPGCIPHYTEVRAEVRLRQSVYLDNALQDRTAINLLKFESTRLKTAIMQFLYGDIYTELTTLLHDYEMPSHVRAKLEALAGSLPL